MPDYEQSEQSLSFDFRTGRATAITSEKTGKAQRAACAALNSIRTLGILEAAQSHAPGEQIPIDVWTSSVERQLAEWDTPVVKLKDLGLIYDAEGFMLSSFLKALTPGAEAEPFFDPENNVVYKLFNLRDTGALGKKLVLERGTDDDEYQVEYRPADLRHTLSKLSVLNEAGGLATEIVGLADSGDFLVCKQPLAFPFKDFKKDLEVSLRSIRAIIPARGGFRQSVGILQVGGAPWIIGDLHDRNIMRDYLGRPVIIDALIGSISPAAISANRWLKDAIDDAKKYRETGKKPSYDLFDQVDDSEL